MSIQTMDRNAAKVISKAIEETIQEKCAELGIKGRAAGGKYDPSVGRYTLKLEFELDGAEEREFAQLAPLFNLSADDYGKTFQQGGKTFKLVGFRTRAPKRPLTCRCEEDGKTYVFPETAARLIVAQDPTD